MRSVKQKNKEKHGMSHSGTYNTWKGMKQRCEDPAILAYERYGGRGITVCDRWRDSFVNFLADMGERPQGKSLDRIDNNGPYAPENCRWATPEEQQQNRRNNRVVFVNGERKLATVTARENGIPERRLRSRLSCGWTVEESVGMKKHPNGHLVTVGDETMNISEWAEKTGISRQAIIFRIRCGWSIEDAVSLPKGAKRTA